MHPLPAGTEPPAHTIFAVHDQSGQFLCWGCFLAAMPCPQAETSLDALSLYYSQGGLQILAGAIPHKADLIHRSLLIGTAEEKAPLWGQTAQTLQRVGRA